MFKIVKSLFVVLAMTAMVAGATSSYYTSSAIISANAFSTGTLEIKVNGESTLAGAYFPLTKPGETYTSDNYNISNSGPSNLSAQKMNLAVTYAGGSYAPLWEKAVIKIDVSRAVVPSEEDWYTVYNTNINALGTVNLFAPGWSDLSPGSSEVMRYSISFPKENIDQSDLMGKSLTWIFDIQARTN